MNKDDFQKFINDNNIQKPIEFRKKFPKIYDKLCRDLNSIEIKSLIYKNRKNDYSDINTIEKLQSFINLNSINSKKELHKYFSGLYVKFSGQLDKVTFIKNNLSIRENYLKNLFEVNNIKYVCQKTYSDLRNNLPLRFDFYLPEYDILIEHPGEGHFGKGRYYSEDLLRNDHLKYNYAKKNKIKLYYYTIYKSEYLNNGYFTEVITESDTLIKKIGLTNQSKN